MPVPAARRADVLARDPHPLVLGRRRQHPLQQLAVPRLQLILVTQGEARLGYAVRERVPDPLQLPEPGDAGLGEGTRYAAVESETREGLGAEARELKFEAADLAPKLGAREALVASHSKRRERVSIEQIRHEPESSVDHPVSAVP